MVKCARAPAAPARTREVRDVTFLFLYGDRFDPAFHRAALTELYRLCRPGGEIRVYPLVTLQWEHYPHLEEVRFELSRLGADVLIRPSRLPFIPVRSDVLLVRKPL